MLDKLLQIIFNSIWKDQLQIIYNMFGQILPYSFIGVVCISDHIKQLTVVIVDEPGVPDRVEWGIILITCLSTVYVHFRR